MNPTPANINPIQDGHFGAAHGWGGEAKRHPFPKICHTSKKYMNHVTHTLISADISIFSLEINKFCYVKKYRYRSHFGT